MKRRMLIMLLGCTVLFGGIFGFKAYVSTLIGEAMDNRPLPPATVSSAVARREMWPDNLNAVGTLRAVAGTDVTTEASGIVAHIDFESGHEVETGDVLLRLDTTTDEAQLAALEAQARLTEQDLERIQSLYERRAVAKSELDRAAAQADSAAANARAQRARSALKVIRAPFSGVLGIRQVDIGQYLSPGAPIVTLQALDPIYVDFRLPQQLSSQLRPGLGVEVLVEAFGERRFGGEVTALEPLVDEATRNFLVRATVGNSERLLKPGMFARVEVTLGIDEDLVVVPQTAVSYNPYGDSVWVIGPGAAESGIEFVAQRRVVRIGRRRGDLVAIVEGLSVGERVATSGLLKLRNGLPVVLNDTIQPSADVAPTPPNS
jgi:membrane fusion protein (multidrug efflux system)